MPLFDTRTPEQRAHDEVERRYPWPPPPPSPLTAVGVFWAVFFAQLCFALLGGIILLIVKFL